MAETAEILRAPYTLEYAYKRSLGPVMSAFLTGLRDGRFVGTRTKGGRVLMPPQAYDPETGEDVDDGFIEVADTGEVVTWCWVHEPRDKHPLDGPFAFALIKLDGADTALLHAVEASSEAVMKTGMRVRADWADERVGRIQDVRCFVPEGGA